MDPDEQNEPALAEEHKPTPKRKKIITASIIIFILLATAIVTAVLFTRAAVRETVQKPVDPNTRIDRAGYINVHESIGDPFALVQNETKTPVLYQKKPVIDACDLLSLESITNQKLLISPGTDAGKISRHFFDGSSTAVNKDWQESNELARDINECDYPLITDKGVGDGSLHIEVYQPEYSTAAGLRSELDDYLRSSEVIEGAAVYNRTSTPIQDKRTFYYLENKGVYVGVEFAIGSDKDQKITRALLESIAKRLGETIAKPHGIASFDYKSQTFSGKYMSACSISTAADVKAIFKLEASPSVQERIAPSTGIVRHGDTKGNFINNHCVRKTNDDSSIAKTLIIEASSFESEAGAKVYFATKKQDSTIAVKTKIGDEVFFNSDGTPENALYFRLGTTVITLAITDPADKTKSPDNNIERLTPVALSVIKRLESTRQ